MDTSPDIQCLLDEMTAAYRAGDAAAIAAMFPADAQLHSPYAPAAIGRPAIEVLHREWVGDGVKDKTRNFMSSSPAHRGQLHGA
jgi:ketosteroid isomerase-like protein